MPAQITQNRLPNASEAEYQAALVQQLKAQNLEVREYVRANGGEIDIWTQDQIIECKRLLTRDALLMALGQLQLYAAAYPKHQLAIAGPLPDAERFPDMRKSAESVVERIRTIGIEVIILKRRKPSETKI